MPTPTEIANEMYAQLKPAAVASARGYIMTRTPSSLQTLMSGIIDSDLNPPPDPSVATIHNGGSVTVKQWDNSAVPGVATVASGTLTSVTPSVIATKAIVANGGSVVVHSLADANVAGSPGAATVSGGVFTSARLTV